MMLTPLLSNTVIISFTIMTKQLSLGLHQKNKEYTCKGCGETFTGHKRIFCNRQCLERHKQKDVEDLEDRLLKVK